MPPDEIIEDGSTDEQPDELLRALEAIHKELSDSDEGDDEDGGLAEPYEEPAPIELISEAEGRRRVSQSATQPREGESAPAEAAAGERDDAGGGGGGGGEGQDKKPPAKQPEEKAEAEPPSYQSIVDATPEEHREAVANAFALRERATPVMEIFDRPGVRSQLTERGVSEAQALDWFVRQLHWSETDPAGYVADVIRQTVSDAKNYSAALKAIADKLGDVELGSTPAKATEEQPKSGGEDDDDLFVDPEVKKLQKEKADLERRLAEQSAGEQPDPFAADTTRFQRQLAEMIGQKDESGQPVYAHVNRLLPTMQMICQQELARGRVLTPDDFPAVYKRAAMMDPELQAAEIERRAEAKAAEARAAAEKEAREARAKAASKAARASRPIQGSGSTTRAGGMSQNTGDDDIRTLVRKFATDAA